MKIEEDSAFRNFLQGFSDSYLVVFVLSPIIIALVGLFFTWQVYWQSSVTNPNFTVTSDGIAFTIFVGLAFAGAVIWGVYLSEAIVRPRRKLVEEIREIEMPIPVLFDRNSLQKWWKENENLFATSLMKNEVELRSASDELLSLISREVRPAITNQYVIAADVVMRCSTMLYNMGWFVFMNENITGNFTKHREFPT